MNKNILFIIHRLFFNGVYKKGGIDRIKEFLEKKHKIVKIEHPFEKINHPSIFTTQNRISQHNAVFNLPFVWIEELFVNLYWIISSKKKYDWAIASDPLNFFSCHILKLFKFVKKTQFHSTDYSYPRFKNIILEFIYQYLYKFSLIHADLITVVSQNMLTYAFKVLPKRKHFKVHLLPNSPNFDDIPKVDPKFKEPHEIAIFIGRWGSQVNINNLINCFKLLKKHYSHLSLNIIGFVTNEYKDIFIKNGLEKVIIFHGLLQYKEAIKKMSQNYIGITSYSKSDSYINFADSIKVREYAAAGLPVVCDNICGTADEVVRFKTGIVYQNTKQMAKALIRLIDDKDLYKELRQNALKWAKEMDKKKLLKNLYKTL